LDTISQLDSLIGPIIIISRKIHRCLAFVGTLLLGVDSPLSSSSQSATDAEHDAEMTDDVHVCSRCNRQLDYQDSSKHHATPHQLNVNHCHQHIHNHYQCFTAADVDAGNHGNRQDASDSPAQYNDVCYSDGTCQHADWWKHKVTCHWIAVRKLLLLLLLVSIKLIGNNYAVDNIRMEENIIEMW